jgi:hypothetical protein
LQEILALVDKATDTGAVSNAFASGHNLENNQLTILLSLKQPV